MAKALKSAGAEVLVVDQKSADSSALFEPMDSIAGSGIEIATSWTGSLETKSIDLVAPSPGVPQNHPALLQADEAGVPIQSEIEIAFNISRAPIVGITGTNGKSTVTALTHHILTRAGRKSVLCGNIAGSGLEETAITAAAAKATDDEVLVAEISSFQLEWVDKFKPAAATITNIAQDHLDRYVSFEAYAATKRRIFRNMSHGDRYVSNSRHPETAMVPHSPCEVDIWSRFSLDAGFLVVDDVRIAMSELWVPAPHSISNLAVSSLLAERFGVDVARSLDSAKTFAGLRNRLEFVAELRGIRFVNNSMCTNPAAVLASLDGVVGNVHLLAGGVSKVNDLSPLIAVGARIQAAYLFGRDAHTLAGPISAGGAQVSIFTTLEESFEAAERAATSGETVLLSPGCASFDQFEDFVARGDRFREIVLGGVRA
jgi:UDP-N-acetylmuramoylalanine--D-glutamate ligase